MTDVLDEIAARTEDRTGRDIALAIGALVGDGILQPGDRLPTVRALAGHLGVSPNTVADAWRLLQTHGAISTDRRRGTRVRARQVRLDGRYWQVPVAPGTIELDLSTGTPDEQLLPSLGPVLHRLHADVTFSSYVDPPIVPALEAEIRRRWPYPPESITIVDGAQDALDRLIAEIVGFGDTGDDGSHVDANRSFIARGALGQHDLEALELPVLEDGEGLGDEERAARTALSARPARRSRGR